MIKLELVHMRVKFCFMMNPTSLKALLLVDEEGSMTGAAELLRCSVSNVTQHLRKLERDLEETLVERAGRGVVLTLAGRDLARRARPVLAQWEGLSIPPTDSLKGTINVAAFPTAYRGLLIPAIAALRRTHPTLRVQSHEADPARAEAELRAGNIDVAVVTWPGVPHPQWNDEFASERVGTDPIDLLVPASHPLAQRTGVSFGDLAGFDLAVSPSADPFRRWLDRHLPDRHRTYYEATEIQTLIEIVRAGLALTALPRVGRGPLTEEISCVPMNEHEAHRDIYAVARRQVSTSAAGHALIRELARQLDHAQ